MHINDTILIELVTDYYRFEAIVRPPHVIFVPSTAKGPAVNPLKVDNMLWTATKYDFIQIDGYWYARSSSLMAIAYLRIIRHAGIKYSRAGDSSTDATFVKIELLDVEYLSEILSEFRDYAHNVQFVIARDAAKSNHNVIRATCHRMSHARTLNDYVTELNKLRFHTDLASSLKDLMTGRELNNDEINAFMTAIRSCGMQTSPHMLIDVYNGDSMTVEYINTREQFTGPIIDCSDYRLTDPIGDKTIHRHLSSVIKRFHAATSNVFEKSPNPAINAPFDYNNLCFAGNFVAQLVRNADVLRASDCDIFVFGDAQTVVTKTNYLIDWFSGPKTYFATIGSVIYVFIEGVERPIQIMSTNAKSVVDILTHFDMTHVMWAIGYDGVRLRVYTVPNAIIAMKYQVTSVLRVTKALRYGKALLNGYHIAKNSPVARLDNFKITEEMIMLAIRNNFSNFVPTKNINLNITAVKTLVGTDNVSYAKLDPIAVKFKYSGNFDRGSYVGNFVLYAEDIARLRLRTRNSVIDGTNEYETLFNSRPYRPLTYPVNGAKLTNMNTNDKHVEFTFDIGADMEFVAFINDTFDGPIMKHICGMNAATPTLNAANKLHVSFDKTIVAERESNNIYAIRDTQGNVYRMSTVNNDIFNSATKIRLYVIFRICAATKMAKMFVSCILLTMPGANAAEPQFSVDEEGAKTIERVKPQKTTTVTANLPVVNAVLNVPNVPVIPIMPSKTKVRTRRLPRRDVQSPKTEINSSDED